MTDEDEEEDEATRPIVLTNGAYNLLVELAGEREGVTALALRVEVSGTQRAEYTYRFTFQHRSDVDSGDVRTSYGDLDIIIPANDVAKLRGAVLDVDIDPRQRALAIRNPNRPGHFGEHAAGESAPTDGTVVERIERIFVDHVNPALAAHSGQVELVRVEDDRAYVRLQGGCHGCAMAKITLSDGIEQALRAAVPEIHHVIDVTNHATGLRPYVGPSSPPTVAEGTPLRRPTRGTP